MPRGHLGSMLTMPQTSSAAQPLPAAHVTTAEVPDVRHIWMPSQRSLCELAVRRVVGSASEADLGNQAARELPACEACIVIAEMLSESARQLTKIGNSDRFPSRAEAIALLGSTTWPWVAKTLIQS